MVFARLRFCVTSESRNIDWFDSYLLCVNLNIFSEGRAWHRRVTSRHIYKATSQVSLAKKKEKGQIWFSKGVKLV